MKQPPLYRAHFYLLEPLPEQVWHGEPLLASIAFSNTGAIPWLTFGNHPVRLSYRWLAPNGKKVIAEGTRTPLPSPIPPNRKLAIDMRIDPPPEPGEYLLLIDLVEEGIGWFSEKGVTPITQPVRCEVDTAPRATIVNGNCVLNDAVGNHVVRQLQTLREAGYNTLLVTEHIDERLPPDIRRSSVAIKLHNINHPDERTQWVVDHLHSSDIVIVNYSTYYELCEVITQVRNAPILFDYHGVTPPSLWDPNAPGYQDLVLGQENLSLVAYADYGFGHSDFTTGELRQTGVVPASRLSVMPYAVVDPTTRCAEHDEESDDGEQIATLIEQYGLRGKHVLLYIGRMARNKRIIDLVEALPLIREHEPDTVLLLVGENTFGPYRDYANEVMQRAKEIGCAEHVIFTGQVPDLHPFYCLCDIFVTASVHEGFCMPVVEAMMHRKPVVAARTTALPQTVGEGGLLFEPEDPADLANKVVYLLGEKQRDEIDLSSVPQTVPQTVSTVPKDRPIIFVTPRYGLEIVGGAERLIRGWAEQLAKRGYTIEVLTTCVSSMGDWSDHYRPGVEHINGVTVRRFPVDKVDVSVFHDVQGRAIDGREVRYSDECAFLDQNLRSRSLNDYLQEQAEEMVCAIFAPYLFGTTFHGIQAVRDKAIVVPCLHDEPAAYFSVFREMLETVAGMFFNAQAEATFARETLHVINPSYGVAGFGFDIDNVDASPGNADTFRRAYHLPEDIILYSGRLEEGKNVPLLLDYFVQYKTEHPGPLTLVLTGKGAGELDMPKRPDIIALGIIPEEQMPNAFAAARLLCQPSVNESFSIVLMESWLQGRPVLVHRHCAVTRDHVEASGGGEIFTGYESFRGALRRILLDPSYGDDLGRKGNAYVRERYNWDTITDAILTGIARFTMAPNDYQRCAQRGVRKALDFTSARFQDALLSMVERARAEGSGGLTPQYMRQLQRTARVGMRGYTVSSSLPVVGNMVSWMRRNMTSHLKEPYLDPIVDRQEQFNHELLQTLFPLLEQNTYELRRLRREIALLREELAQRGELGE